MKRYARHLGVAILGVGLGWSIPPLSLSVAGWAWFVPWLFSIVACPLIMSLLAPTREVVYGPLPNVVSAVSLAYYSCRSTPGGSAGGWLGVTVLLGVCAVLFGLAVSGAVHSWRGE
jgi:hypothetical protein